MAAVLDWARAQTPAEPVGAFIVGYNPAFPLFPAVVLLGDEERGRWNVAEFEHETLELLETEDFQRVRQAWQDEHGPPEKLYARIAKRLAAEDYSFWPLADDFVVVAVSMDTHSDAMLARQLRASVPKPLLAEFKRRGWLAH